MVVRARNQRATHQRLCASSRVGFGLGLVQGRSSSRHLHLFMGTLLPLTGLLAALRTTSPSSLLKRKCFCSWASPSFPWKSLVIQSNDFQTTAYDEASSHPHTPPEPPTTFHPLTPHRVWIHFPPSTVDTQWSHLALISLPLF